MIIFLIFTLCSSLEPSCNERKEENYVVEVEVRKFRIIFFMKCIYDISYTMYVYVGILSFGSHYSR